jgi:hypothetical protein
MQDIVAEIDRRKLECDLRERTLKFTQRLDTDWRLSRRHVDQLGNLLIAGAIEVTYSALGSTVSKPRYLGCFIFSTYLIMIRPKKATFYEPKYWFPLYLADFEDLTDIEGKNKMYVYFILFLSCFSLAASHHFSLGFFFSSFSKKEKKRRKY